MDRIRCKKFQYYFSLAAWLFLCTFVLFGCTSADGNQDISTNRKHGEAEGTKIVDQLSEELEEKGDLADRTDEFSKAENELPKEDEKIVSKEAMGQEETGKETGDKENIRTEAAEADWSEYFDGCNGAAVLYDAAKGQYILYNSELAMTRRSPCSTFKIISSLVGLENGIIAPDNSVRSWSGEIFWNESWNKDIDFREAFQSSCVWYFRKVIDDIGKELMQEELDRLQYGNCDISDWEGRLNTNNNNRALTGFWIESSLTISPKEQVEVMERIFGENTVINKQVREELKEVMLVPEQKNAKIAMYGKTGMGKADGVTVDAWFTGFAERAEGNIYYCVYLGRTENKNVTSSLAKEIAIKLISDYCSEKDTLS